MKDSVYRFSNLQLNVISSISKCNIVKEVSAYLNVRYLPKLQISSISGLLNLFHGFTTLSDAAS